MPLNVRAVLEEKSPKYQQVMIGSVKGQIAAQTRQERDKYTTMNISNSRGPRGNKIDLIDRELQKSRLTKPVVIPSTLDVNEVKKVYTKPEVVEKPKTQMPEIEMQIPEVQNPTPDILQPQGNPIEEELDKRLNIANNETAQRIEDIETQTAEPIKKGRGRPKKERTPEELEREANKEKRGRGRPKKIVEEPETEQEEVVEEPAPEIDLFGMASDEEKDNSNSDILPGLEDEEEGTDGILPGLLDEEDDDVLNNNMISNINENKQEQSTILPGFEPDNTPINNIPNNMSTNNTINNMPMVESRPIYEDDGNLANLLTGDKKIAAFVGTSKNGTSFLVNNLAALLSSKGINTAILDLTKNKNSYYIYTLNEDSLRNKAFSCIEGLRRGVADGIRVNNNLTVYTNVAKEDNSEYDDYSNILETLVKNHSLILLDCDFDTNMNYFSKAQEIYLVQTYDILTIQPLTLFLNELKYKNGLDQNKLRIVINKSLNLKKLTSQLIIGGISCYNDPASTYINTLFDKDKVRCTIIPFEEQTYARYLERMVDCEISLNGYSRMFLDALEKLGDMVYPLIAGGRNQNSTPVYGDYNKRNATFNSSMNETLNKMRNKF
mgnify:FL=1